MLGLVPGSQKKLNKWCLLLLSLYYPVSHQVWLITQGQVPALHHLLIVGGKTQAQDEAETEKPVQMN